MNLEEALQINYELAELAVEQVQRLHSFARWNGKHLSNKLIEIQLKSNQFSFSIQHTRILIERCISRLDINEPLNSKGWITLLDTMELTGFVLSRVKESDTPDTRATIEKINDQICTFQQAIEPQVDDYNRLVHSARSCMSGSFDLNSLFKLPKIDDLPVVLNTAKLTLF